MITYKQFSLILQEDFAKSKKEHSDLSPSIISHYAENADPTKGKNHLSWILKMHKLGKITLSDSSKVKELLEKYEKHKSKLSKEDKDFNKHQSLQNLEDAINQKHGIPIFSKNGIEVTHLNTAQSAKYHCNDKPWCVKHEGNFNSYNEKGKLYLVHARDENGNIKKYLFHHEGLSGTPEYNDSKNEPIENIDNFIERNPELREVKEWQGKHPRFTSDENFNKNFKELLHNNPKDTLNDSRITAEHLNNLISNSNEDPAHRVFALNSKNLKKLPSDLIKSHLNNILDNPKESDNLKAAVIKNSNFKKLPSDLIKSHLNNILGNKYDSDFLKGKVLNLHKSYVNGDHIDNILNNPESLNKETILNDPELFNKMSVINRKKHIRPNDREDSR